MTFSVVLDTAPTADVVISVGVSDLAEASATVSQLVFTPANFGVPQTVTVTGADDGEADSNEWYSVVLGPAASADPRFAGFDPADLDLVNVQLFPKGARSFRDTDGDRYTVRLTGPGRMGVILASQDADGTGSIGRIVVDGTDPKRSAVSVAVTKGATGDGRVAIGAVDGGTLRAVRAPRSDLVGDGIAFSGYLGGLTVRDIKNGADIIAGGTPRWVLKCTSAAETKKLLRSSTVFRTGASA